MLLQAGAPPDAERWSATRISPIGLACRDGLSGCVQTLLLAGASVDSKDYNGGTPLQYAADYAQFECARVLLLAGATKGIRILSGPLYTADAMESEDPDLFDPGPTKAKFDATL